ncbi:MAG: diaminopropionate ammonia-lyase [Clostridia bacterium]|nr:diaminopropionate ammonia-lyase [Clostridia bacterium]
MNEIQFAPNDKRHSTDTRAFSQKATECVRRLHQATPGYARTPLIERKDLARRLGIGAVFVKDESKRFGLNAFKGLGGVYAMHRMICEALGLDGDDTTPRQRTQPPYPDRVSQLTFVTTTDGNHGKGVSWAAGLYGCKAHVFMPRGSVEARAQAIRDAGSADVTITDLRYDDCVRHTRALAEKNGWFLIQDTAWPGYEKVPLWIMQGYTTLYFEALSQMRALGSAMPTHLLLQAGVGAMAGAIAGAALESCGDTPPVIATVEAREVACFYESFERGDGLPHPATGSGETIMAGLNCAEPCTIAWEILGGRAVGGFACADTIAERGMRLLAEGQESAGPVISGESGAVTAGLAEALAEPDRENLRNALGLDSRSVLLLISTEGDTDPENYRRVVSGRSRKP